MMPEMLSAAIGLIDDDIIQAADEARIAAPKKRSRIPVWVGLGSMAACAAVIVSVALTNVESGKLPTEGMQNYTSTSQATASDSDAAHDESGGQSAAPMETEDICNDPCESADDAVLDEAPVATTEAVNTNNDSNLPENGDTEIDDAVFLPVQTADAPIEEEDAEETVLTQTGEAKADTGEAIEPEEAIETEEAVNETQEAVDESEESLPEYDHIFVESTENASTGAPMTYDEVMTAMTESQYGSLDSYFLFRVERALTIGECEELDGFAEAYRTYYPSYSDETSEVGAVDDDRYPSDFIVYEVTVAEDLISGEQRGDKMYILSTGSSIAYQRLGDPPYASGEYFAAALMMPIEGTDIRRTTGSFTLRYDVRGDTAYSRNNYPIDELHLPNSTDISEELITSTTQNPARYTQSLPLESLCDFLREDWQQRGVSRHFSNTDTE